MGTVNIAELADAGKRASDIINLHLAFTPFEQLQSKWMAFRLQDGSSDGVLYDSKRDAVRHQLDEFLCFYVPFRHLAAGSKPHEMEVFIKFNRDAYDHGFRLPDPDEESGGPDLIMTTMWSDYYQNLIDREKRRIWLGR